MSNDILMYVRRYSAKDFGECVPFETISDILICLHFSAFSWIPVRVMLRTWKMTLDPKKIRQRWLWDDLAACEAVQRGLKY